jgi:hypothetical protein
MHADTGLEPLLRRTDAKLARPLAEALVAARADVIGAVDILRGIGDADLTKPWAWKGGSEEEIRYGFYRINECFELAGIDAEASLRSDGRERGRAADLIAPATAARWDLQGLLRPLPDTAWDADPGGGEWTIRATLAHLIGSQRSYGVTTAWWLEQAHAAADPDLPASVPDAIDAELPTDEAEGEGTPAEIRERLDLVLDRSSERLSGLPPDRLAYGARWSGFAVDIAFRLGRWSSHIREHTVQVEKTLVMLDHRPTEVDRLIRLILAAWGRAEATVYGHAEQEPGAAALAAAAVDARATATEIAALARA